MDRTLVGIFSSLSAALVTVGFAFSRTVDGPADLRFVAETELQTLDPQIMTGTPEARIAEALFEGLTRYDAKTHYPAPGVAESWNISPDGKRYTFHLRPNARWTNGRAVVASDFVYSWKRLLDPTLGSEYSYIAFPIRYAEALATFDARAEAIDGSILPALRKLSAESAGGVGARVWQRFLTDNHVFDAISREPDPAIASLLSRRTGAVASAELAGFTKALAPIAGRLRAEARDARAHFGVDGGIFAADDRTFVVELRAPTPYFLDLMSFHAFLPSPREVVEDPARRDDWFLPNHIVSNGPFRLTRWVVNDHMRLERNELYWGKDEVRTKSIDALTVENETTALNLYLAGEADWLVSQHYPTDLVDDLKRRPDFFEHAGLIVYFYRFNTTRPPYDDRRVRKAFTLAVDRKLIVDTVLRLGQTPATTFVPPGLAGYESPRTEIRFDPEAARALLAEAGFPGGKGFPEVGILYNTSEAHKKIAEVVADELRTNLGIRANAYNQEWQSFLATTRNLDFDMARAAWVGDYPDPNTFLDMWVTNGGNNQTGFSSQLYDELIHTAADVSGFLADPGPLLSRLKEPDKVRPVLDAARAGDPVARLRAMAEVRLLLLREAEAILVDDEFPILPVYFYVLGALVRPEVRGFYPTLQFEDGHTAPNLQDIYPLRDIWVDRSARSAP